MLKNPEDPDPTSVCEFVKDVRAAKTSTKPNQSVLFWRESRVRSRSSCFSGESPRRWPSASETDGWRCTNSSSSSTSAATFDGCDLALLAERRQEGAC